MSAHGPACSHKYTFFDIAWPSLGCEMGNKIISNGNNYSNYK